VAGERLVSFMLSAGRDAIPNSEKLDLLYGKVTSIDPLEVQVVNEPKLILTEEFLLLSPLCKKKEFTIPEWNTEEEEEHTHQVPSIQTYDASGHVHAVPSQDTEAGVAHKHTILKHTVEVWRGLEVDDIVLMLRVLRGAKYYLLQREGDL